MGMVGSLRKRVLLLWQAVEFSRSSERPNVATLQVVPPSRIWCPAMGMLLFSQKPLEMYYGGKEAGKT